MAYAKIVWLQKKQFVGIDGSNHSVVISTQDEDNGVGMKPSDLMLVALASCTAVDVVQILEKKRMPVSSLTIEVSAEQENEPPWTFKTIHLEYKLSGNNLSEKDVRQAIDLSEEKYCSVSASLRGTVEITTGFELEKTEH